MQGPEEEDVIKESEALVKQARRLLKENLNEADVTKLYTHRAANVIIMKQIDMVHDMVQKGELDAQDAYSIFNVIAKDNKTLETERDWHKQDIIRNSVSKRIAEVSAVDNTL